MSARTPAVRARWARQGLATRRSLDPTTQAMLLRQLYLSHFAQGDYERALEVARQAVDLGVLPDVLHQDAARAALAAGDVRSGVAHLRMAARRGPASRRAYHFWTLGSALFLAHRYPEAVAALERAVRWGTDGKPLYRAHLALVRLAMGERVADLQRTIELLGSAPVGQGYGRFVLGHLAYASGAWEAARRYLRAFVRRSAGDGPGRATVLRAELAMARATLSKKSRL
jgi:tetratricopeptide (TPR) repeat protein